jgi:hypothetical protein
MAAAAAETGINQIIEPIANTSDLFISFSHRITIFTYYKIVAAGHSS